MGPAHLPWRESLHNGPGRQRWAKHVPVPLLWLRPPSPRGTPRVPASGNLGCCEGRPWAGGHLCVPPVVQQGWLPVPGHRTESSFLHPRFPLGPCLKALQTPTLIHSPAASLGGLLSPTRPCLQGIYIPGRKQINTQINQNRILQAGGASGVLGHLDSVA